MIARDALARCSACLDIVGFLARRVFCSGVVAFGLTRGFMTFVFVPLGHRPGRSMSAAMVGPVSLSVRDGKERTCQPENAGDFRHKFSPA
jgi:hypothetical protein